jgi:hypothetical protein
MRYVVKMEIEATIEPTEQQSAEDEQFGDDYESIVFERKRFDLCPECYRKFIKNPVGREKLVPFGFSHN